MKHTLKYLVVGYLLIQTPKIFGQTKVADLDININDDYSSFAMLDSLDKDYKVFFTGENHNFRTSNYKLQLKMMKYLYKKYGVRHLFLEFGISRGWLVNNYVQNGDSTLFKVLKDYSYDEYALLYKELWKFNEDLPDDKKIMVHGIDIERSYSTPVKVMRMLLPNQKPPKEIQLNIETLIALAGKVDEEHNKFDPEEDGEKKKNYYDYGYNYYNTYNTDKTLEEIIRDYDSLTGCYQSYLGDNAPLFDEIVRGVKAEFQREKFIKDRDMQSYIYREQFMYDELVKLTQEYPNDKFYGQFGRCHTALEEQDKWCDFYFFNSLASRIKYSEEPTLKEKVLSIGIYYPNSNTFEIEASEKDQLQPLFLKQENKGIKLIKLEKQDSIYFKGIYDKYQFIIVNYDGFKIEETNVEKDPWLENDYNDFDYGYLFPNIEGHYGVMFMNLKSLKSTFENYGLNTYNAPQTIYGFAATFYEDWFLYGSVSAHFLPKTESKYSDTASLSFSGYFVKGYFGFETTIDTRFNVTPRLGVGYGRIALKQTFDNPVPGSSNSIFVTAPNNELEFKNDGFLLDPGIDIRYNIRYIALGLNAGYQIDFSGKEWIGANQGTISGSPRVGLSGFYVVGTLSLFYSMW